MSATDFDLAAEKRRRLRDWGNQATTAFLDRFDWQQYLLRYGTALADASILGMHKGAEWSARG